MKSIQKFYSKKGELLAVQVEPELWAQIEKACPAALREHIGIIPKRIKEPIQDWETLCSYWDFRYPVDYDVECELCGLKTDNWQKDDPRKFTLKAASLGGLVSFECTGCHARISKKHFKDKITVETCPGCECTVVEG